MGISIVFRYRLHFDEENYICDRMSAFCSATTSAIFEVINPCVLIKGRKTEKGLDLILDPKKVYMDSISWLCFFFLRRRVTNIET